MVDKITVKPESIRAYGNVLMEDRSINEYKGHKSALFENVAVINGETFRVFHEVFSVYALGFNFNPGTKELYVGIDDDTVITDFNFDRDGKELRFESTLYYFGYDDDLKKLYVNDVPVVVYSLEFEESSYTAVGGSATVSAILLGDGKPVSGASVTFTSDASTSITATTNENGVASTIITFSESTTLTASYESVSDTAAITVYFFYDACNSTYKSSEYGTIIKVSSSTTTNYTAYDSTENAYLVRANGDWGCLPITALTGKDNYKLSAYFKPKGTTTHLYRGGFGLLEQNTTTPFYNFRIQGNGELSYSKFNGSKEQDQSQTLNLNVSNYHKMEIIKQGNNYTFNWYDTDDTTIIKTINKTISLSTPIIGLYLCCGSNYGCYVKEIKAESL